MGLNPTVFHIHSFFFKTEETCTFMNEHFQLEISFKCDIKAENSSTLSKFHEGRKGLRSMGSNADNYGGCFLSILVPRAARLNL